MYFAKNHIFFFFKISWYNDHKSFNKVPQELLEYRLADVLQKQVNAGLSVHIASVYRRLGFIAI